MVSINRDLLPVHRDGEEKTIEATSSAERLYGECLAEVFKGYLPFVKDAYKVIPCGDELPPTESVASFDVTKLVVEKNDKLIEKLKNVYHLLADSDDSIALIVNCKSVSAKVTIAVSTHKRNSESARAIAESVRDALMGNFPGSECAPVRHFCDENDGAFRPLNKNSGFAGPGYNSVGIVSNIATDFSEDFLSQGIEKLIDGIRLARGKEYTIVLIGESADARRIEQRKERLYQLYTAMSPYAKISLNWGINESDTWTSSFTKGGSVSASQGLPIPVLPSVSMSIGKSQAKTQGVSSSQTVEIEELGVQHMMETLRKQVSHVEACEALGSWEFAAYVFSPDYGIVNEVSHMYLSLTQGAESYYVKPAINIWNARSSNSIRAEIDEIRKYVSRLRHPLFEKLPGVYSTVFNESNWPDRIKCVASISGAELVRAMSLPRKSVPGFAVVECAPFGREITSYDALPVDGIAMGRIHHMHHDEESTVRLSYDSLASHVFVTGSTGSGKSNTVYRLLDQANKNFLVIEPAKGEYRHAFGSEARYFGTNTAMGDLLRVNPFAFPEGIHVLEHVDRLLEVFNVCWPMYAAMPAVLKDAVIRSYERCGWNLLDSRNKDGMLFPTFVDVCDEVDSVIESSDYSEQNKGDYRGSLKTRLKSLTNGLNGLVLCNGSVSDEELFDSKVIVDLSRLGSAESKSLIMGVLVIRLQEHRMCQRSKNTDEELKHLTVLEEAHNLLRASAASSSPELGGGMAAKSVEMLSSAIAEMRTYGEGFVIVDQAPGLLDMSAIRNTNTKIIMRLPDLSDRELVGRAANLNEEQIQELARLQRGVAAIYQNEWVEPVLCHIDRHEKPENVGLESIEVLSRNTLAGCSQLNDDEERYINTCLYDPSRLFDHSRYDFNDCVKRANLSGSDKALLLEYARTPIRHMRVIHGHAAFSRFSIDELVKNAAKEARPWDDLLADHMAHFSFEQNVSVGPDAEEWALFSSSVLAWAQGWIRTNLKEPARSE